MSNVLLQEEIDKLSGLSEEPEPVKSTSEQSNILSQEEIDKLSGNDEKKEEAIDVAIKEVKNDIEKPSSDTNNIKTIVIKKNEIDDAYVKENNIETEVKNKKTKGKNKIIIIVVFLLAVILLSAIGYFSIGYFTADKPENEILEAATNEELFVDKKKEKQKVEIILTKASVKAINKGVDLFLYLYKKNGIEEVIIKSEELIVLHDMDVSEENLKLCLAFDLSASLIDSTKLKKSKINPNEYFQITKLNQRYKKRLMNAGYNNEEADKFILKWGKKTIELLKEIINKNPDILKSKIFPIKKTTRIVSHATFF